MDPQNAKDTGQVPVSEAETESQPIRIGDAPPPIPACEACGVSGHFASLTRPDGDPRGIAKCLACGWERDIIHEAFGGKSPRVADPVSPWETPRSSEAELRWYYSQSDGDLGAHSSWEQQVQQAHFGSPESAAVTMFFGEASASNMPPAKMWAARRVAWIREALAQLPRVDQAALEASFSLRRRDVQLAGVVGAELEPVVAFLIASGQLTVKELTKSKPKRDAVKEQAGKLLAAALAAYEAARSSGREAATEAPAKREREAPERRQAGPKGASSRRLVPVEAERGSWNPPRPL